MPTRIKLVLGAAQFGRNVYPMGSKVNTVEDAQKLVDLFVNYGQDKLDTARRYGAGTSEEVLKAFLTQLVSELDLKGCTVDTKVYPNEPGGLKAEKVKESLATSVKALGGVKIQTFYLHKPDRSTPIEETLRAVNDLYEEGAFEEFGLSNFAAWEVAKVVCTADKHGWIKPTVYQGLYNAVERTVENELFPCLRHFGIRFYAYSPLASGLLSGRTLTEAGTPKPGGRWDPSVSVIAGPLQKDYGPMFPVVMELKDSLDKMNVTLSQCAFRWLQYHSKLDPDAGDRIIVGASSLTQLESNLKDSDGGPLEVETIRLLDSTWLKVKPTARYYA